MSADETSAPARRAPISMRVAVALLGGVVLLASGVGAYLSLSPTAGDRPVATSQPAVGFSFRPHPAPRPLPNIAFEDDAERKLTLADVRGKVVLLNVWATWCAPCREEMPALDRLQQKLGGPGFEVIALSIDNGGPAAVRRFYDEIGIRALAIYVDAATRATAGLAVVGIPTTLLIDRQGREIGRRTGPAQWDEPQAVRMIAGYLGSAGKP